MTGRENIYTNASIFGLTRKEVARRMDAIIRFSELEGFSRSHILYICSMEWETITMVVPFPLISLSLSKHFLWKAASPTARISSISSTSAEGRVTVNGRVSSLIELGAGFHPDMTGRENIYTNASIFGLTRKEVEGGIAYRQNLIDQQHVRVHVDGHGEGQAHVHARGIGPPRALPAQGTGTSRCWTG